MKNPYLEEEVSSVRAVLDRLESGDYPSAIRELEALKTVVHAAIPDKQRVSRGITWVVQRVAGMMVEVCAGETLVRETALTLYKHIDRTDMLQGVPVFMMAEYGKEHPLEVLDFFEGAASAEDWVLREFAQGAFRKLHKQNKEVIRPWLERMVTSENPNSRRFVSEMLRPVVQGQWLRKDPSYSLSLLRHLFKESNAYPRTSVGNNLSDLSRYQSELIFSIVEELVESGDKNSYWIAQRACRNLVKNYPERVLDVLGVEEYRYKDRYYKRGSAER